MLLERKLINPLKSKIMKNYKTQQKLENNFKKFVPTDTKWINKLLNSSYIECCNLLKDKYGAIKESYFSTSECKSCRAKIKRTKEGLQIHHIDEDKGVALSNKEHAKNNPWEWQQGDRLVYCNLLEHLILHIKIVEYPNDEKQNPIIICGVGGIVDFLVPQLNDIYSGIEYKQQWMQALKDQVKDLENEYLQCIAYLLKLKVKNISYIIKQLKMHEKFSKWNQLHKKLLLLMSKMKKGEATNEEKYFFPKVVNNIFFKRFLRFVNKITFKRIIDLPIKNHLFPKKYVFFNEQYKLLTSLEARYETHKALNKSMKKNMENVKPTIEKKLNKNKSIFEKLKNIGVTK